MNGAEPFADAEAERRASEKKRLRARIRGKRRSLSAEFLRRESEAFLPLLSALAEWKKARTVMAYAALPGEPDLSPVLREVLSSGRQLVLPRCEGGEIVPRRVSGLWQLSPGAYGIPEPGADCPRVDPEEIGFFLVPGLAFDREGFRLGQGGGYYDRFLPKSCGYRLGVCHEWELLPAVPAEAHDVRVNGVLSGNGQTCRREQPAPRGKPSD